MQACKLACCNNESPVCAFDMLLNRKNETMVSKLKINLFIHDLISFNQSIGTQFTPQIPISAMAGNTRLAVFKRLAVANGKNNGRAKIVYKNLFNQTIERLFNFFLFPNLLYMSDKFFIHTAKQF